MPFLSSIQLLSQLTNRTRSIWGSNKNNIHMVDRAPGEHGSLCGSKRLPTGIRAHLVTGSSSPAPKRWACTNKLINADKMDQNTSFLEARLNAEWVVGWVLSTWFLLHYIPDHSYSTELRGQSPALPSYKTLAMKWNIRNGPSDSMSWGKEHKSDETTHDNI